MSPPISVTVITGSLFCMTKPADSVLNGRLRGAMTFGLFASSENSDPRLCRMNPYPGTVMPDPNSSKLLLTHDTMLPALSPADSTMVSPFSLAFPFGPGVDARDGFTLPQSDAAYVFDRSLAVGTATAFRSALYR